MDSNNFNNGQQPSPYYNNANAQPPQKAPNIFRQFVLAFMPNQYGRLAKVKTGSMIGFVVLLALLATIIEFVRFSAVMLPLVNQLETSDTIPDFSIRNGELSLSREVIFDQDGMFIYITDEVDKFTRQDAKFLEEKGYTQILLLSRTNMAVVNANQYQEMKWSEFGNTTAINKEWLLNTLMPIVWVFVIVGYLCYFVGRVFWYFFCAAIYLLVALIISSIMNKKVSGGALYRAAVYSKVFMFVIMTVVGLIPFINLLLPGILRTPLRFVLTSVFMGFAISKLPDNC